MQYERQNVPYLRKVWINGRGNLGCKANIFMLPQVLVIRSDYCVEEKGCGDIHDQQRLKKLVGVKIRPRIGRRFLLQTNY